MTSPGPPPYGQLGVLRTTSDAVECHGCGGWYANLGAHAWAAHGLSGDEYRREFGLMQRTKLTAPNLRAPQSRRARDHLIDVGEPHREAIRHIPAEERSRRAKKAERRVEHELHPTEPGRTRPMLEARFGPEGRMADEVLQEAVDVFVEELAVRSRGVWVRTGERLGVGWSTARARVYLAAERGLIRLEGERIDLAATLPDGTRVIAPDSFDAMFSLLRRYIDQHGSPAVNRSALFEGLPLGKWVESVKSRWRKGSLPDHQRIEVESLPGWQWPEEGPYRGGSVPKAGVDLGVRWDRWQAAFQRLEAFVDEHGHARVPARFRSADGFTLGAWVGDQRRRYRAGRLHDDLGPKLESVPSTWTPKPLKSSEPGSACRQRNVFGWGLVGRASTLCSPGLTASPSIPTL